MKHPKPRKKPRTSRRKAAIAPASASIWGILPDQIQPTDLVHINNGLEFLFDELREAAEQHQIGDNGGRSATIQAVEAVTQFLLMFGSVHKEGLDVPLALLANALRALERNTIEPLVKPVSRSGRAPASDVRQALKGLVAYTVRRLQDFGLDDGASRQAVAGRLRALHIKPDRGSYNLTARTIREWREATAADGPGGVARWMFNTQLAHPQNKAWDRLPKEAAIQALLDNLTNLIGRLRASELQ